MHAKYRSWRLVFAVAAFFQVGTPSKADPCLDVALVLAVDVSSSVDAREYVLQVNGIAAAFRHDEVRATVRSAGRVAVSVVFWADEVSPVNTISWIDIGTDADAERLAAAVENAPREIFGNTGLGRGVWEAIELLDAPGFCARRKIINVSGDGMETIAPRFLLNRPDNHPHISMKMAKQRAEKLGITINALAITNSYSGIVHYYRTQVISGPSAFVMEVSSYRNFADAIKMKIIREIEPIVAHKTGRNLLASLQ
jgi:hypothetical protein